MARGGNRPPERPAAVSNPGSGRRTDGGAGSKSQPLRVPTGGAYGQAQASENQQKGAPLAAGGPAQSGGGPPAGSGGQGVPSPGGGVFGPTERPGEPATFGAMTGPQAASQNVDHLIRMMYAKFPNPAIAQLMKKEPEKRATNQ
jgi:hypothetical protein